MTWNLTKVPDGLLSSGDLVMSINNPHLRFSEEKRDTSILAGNEDS